MKTFQYISDIHLDIIPYFTIEPNAEYLILAGDIGSPLKENYKDFITQCSQKFKDVFLISGNHEYYNSHHSKDEIDICIQKLINEFNNVHYLYKSSFQLDNDTIIIGTTLWSFIDYNYRTVIAEQMSDYQRIKVKIFNQSDKSYRRYHITPSDTLKWHMDEYNWLKNEIKRNQHQKIIVITHHCPTLHGIHDKYKKYKYLNSAFASDLGHLFEENRINYWIYGHTHTAMNFEFHGCRLLCNPVGYEDEEDTGYQYGKRFEL